MRTEPMSPTIYEQVRRPITPFVDVDLRVRGILVASCSEADVSFSVLSLMDLWIYEMNEQYKGVAHTVGQN